MPGFASETKKRFKEPLIMNLSEHTKSKKSSPMMLGDNDEPVLPGLPDDVAKHCLALVPRSNFPAMGAVSKKWRSYLRSKELISVRKLAGAVEEWLYILTSDSEEGKESRWEVVDCLGRKNRDLPAMPGLPKLGFGVVVLNGKLLVIGGYSVINGAAFASPEVYQYDSCLNSWSKLADMNVARYDFACTELDGAVYAVGGNGESGDSLSSAESYDPDADTWRPIAPIRRPRWGCLAAGFRGKLYVMGGRSSFTIGNSKFVDVYTPESSSWAETKKNGCVMVTAHAALGERLFCMEWKDQRRVSVFDPSDGSWKKVNVPVTGSTRVGFRFGVLDGKLLLFSARADRGYRTLVFDPEAEPGSEWLTLDIKPSGSCLNCVTIKA